MEHIEFEKPESVEETIEMVDLYSSEVAAPPTSEDFGPAL